MQPQLKPGQILDPDSMYAKRWPGKPALVKLKDNLILSIPPQYHQFWTQRHWLTGIDQAFRPPYPLQDLPYANSAGFTMHMPDFAGYSPDNYLADFDENRINVIQISSAPMSYLEPGAPGTHPPNGLERLIKYKAIDPTKFYDKYGLRCYLLQPRDVDEQTCYGIRSDEPVEYLIFRIAVKPYHESTLFPLMRTTYFSQRYGGVEISWYSHIDNFPRWREIDAQIWKYIATWNIAPSTSLSDLYSSPASSPISPVR